MLTSLFKLPYLILACSWPFLASLVGLAGLSLSSDSDLNINMLRGMTVGPTGTIEGGLSCRRFDLVGVLVIWTIIRDPMLAPSRKKHTNYTIHLIK